MCWSSLVIVSIPVKIMREVCRLAGAGLAEPLSASARGCESASGLYRLALLFRYPNFCGWTRGMQPIPPKRAADG
jgi:hypothetical protein